MSKERSIKNWYRDPQNAVIGGVCAGIAESADIDTLLVRVTAIALCLVTFGLAIVLYLVLFAILPIRPSSGSFIELEPSRVQSERYRRVVNLSKDHVLSGKPEVRVYEQKAPTPAVLRSKESSTPSYRLPLVFFGLAFLITTVVIVVATLAEEGRSFVSFLPLYFIPAGVFFLVSPSARRTIPIRICIFLLFCEAGCVVLPFTVGLYDFRNFFVQAPTFFVWVTALALLFAAIIFENTTCYVGAILLIFVASIITFYEFGVLTLPSYITFENFKSFIALGLL